MRCCCAISQPLIPNQMFVVIRAIDIEIVVFAVLHNKRNFHDIRAFPLLFLFSLLFPTSSSLSLVLVLPLRFTVLRVMSITSAIETFHLRHRIPLTVGCPVIRTFAELAVRVSGLLLI